nr:hypothetical protein GCM10020185_35620 [Pseudomonas brassicacearum subsp. brassicacearum]
MKYISTGSTAPQPQIAIAEFLKGGHFEPHLRRMRTQYQRNRDVMIDWVSRYFPSGTRASRPRGSFMLWVELPDGFDTLKLNRVLLDQGVQVAVGSIFFGIGQVPQLPADELRCQANGPDRRSRAQGRNRR